MMKFVSQNASQAGLPTRSQGERCHTPDKGAGPMNFQLSEKHTQHESASRRQHEHVDALVLSELNPLVVVDHLDGEHTTLTLLTFGSVREVCPKCQQGNLKLVLRQTSV